MLLCFFICGLAGEVQARTIHILFLNSYHVGYKWSDEEYQGFVETLARDGKSKKVALHVEYLDMKRYSGEERYASMADILARKYKDIPIDLLVSADDSAFLLLQRYGAAIFPGTPVFFCGTNYLDPAVLQSLPNFHGVNETAEIEETFATILKVLPFTRRIYIINDLTITGRKVHPQLERAITRFRDRLDFTLWEDISMPELLARLPNLPTNSVVFYTFFLQDKTGRTFEYDQAMRLIHQQSPVPIFGAWDFNLGLGLTGGMLTSGYQQGKKLAALVNYWLAGTPLAEIPPLSSSPNRYMFDYRQLDRFHLYQGDLPEGSIIINRPVSFVQKHRPVLITCGIFIALLLIVISVLTINIFRRKKAEKGLLVSEENFRAIFNNANDGLYQATADSRFLRVNPALAGMLKFATPSEVVSHFTDIDAQLYTSPAARRTFLDRCRNIGWAKEEHCLLRRDGSVINVIENVHAVCDEEGRLLYYEGSITDITEYKKTQELIAQTEKIISLGGVSAGIAHEIRSPLSSIVQGVQVLQSRLFDSNPANLQAAGECGVPLESFRQYAEKREIGEMLSHIHEAGRRAGIIIEDMLSFSRKTIGDFSMESLEKILDMALELARKDHDLKTRYHFKELRMTKEYEQNMPKVQCSASKLQQVFFNILKNGAEAMGDAATVSPGFTLRLIKDGTLARVEIEDNGPGMDTDLQQRIFDPFFTTKGREQGTGLGLSVSYFIIKENHHGNLRVESHPGRGATFIVELPLNGAGNGKPAAAS